MASSLFGGIKNPCKVSWGSFLNTPRDGETRVEVNNYSSQSDQCHCALFIIGIQIVEGPKGGV